MDRIIEDRTSSTTCHGERLTGEALVPLAGLSGLVLLFIALGALL